MNPKDWRFPSVCRECHDVCGYPSRITDWTDETVTVEVRCAACKHTWEISGYASEVFPPRIVSPGEPYSVH